MPTLRAWNGPIKALSSDISIMISGRRSGGVKRRSAWLGKHAFRLNADNARHLTLISNDGSLSQGPLKGPLRGVSLLSQTGEPQRSQYPTMGPKCGNSCPLIPAADRCQPRNRLAGAFCQPRLRRLTLIQLKTFNLDAREEGAFDFCCGT